MRLPVVRGVIDRRILVNYRVDTAVLARLLPPPFQPKVVNGVGIAGICLIRLKGIRPRFLPSMFGIASENAAHRIAVVWEVDGERREGVYIPRRDTSSRLNGLVGGRLFPGVHHQAHFKVEEKATHFRVALHSHDSDVSMMVAAEVTSALPTTSVFGSIEAASAFFEAGSLGYSATEQPTTFDGLELRSFHWRVEPLRVLNVHSSFFEDEGVFPTGSTQFDCALLMRGIDHEWHARDSLCVFDV